MLVGCKKPPVVQGLGVPVVQDGVSVTVTGAKLIRPEYEGLRGAVVSENPVLELTVELVNNSESPVSYDLGWNQTVSKQQQSILVFAGSDPELAVSEANQISAINLSDMSYLNDPVTGPATVAPGTSLTDKLLFNMPPEGTQSLLVSIPPNLFPNSELPGYVQLPWQPNEVSPLPAVQINEVYEGDGFSFKVTDVSTEWVRLRDASGEVGITSEPLVKISFTVTNTTEDPVTYRPTRERGAVAFPILLQADGTGVTRATIGAAFKVNGQIETRQQVQPGASVEDFMLFRRPPQGVDRLKFVFPGKRIGASGQARVELDYSWQDPPKPAEWQVPAPAESEPSEE